MNPTILIIETFLKTLSIQPGDKILAAVSGGADSLAMLHLLKTKTGDSPPFTQSKIYPQGIENRKSSILCAHINHHLRGTESDKDESFVADLCADWNIPLYIEQIDVRAYAAKEKLSIETAARQLRLEALEGIAHKTGCNYIATAHHKDDQAETVLFRLLRGTAFAGLAGIRPIREHNSLNWIRPMLNIRRSQIESYCRQNNIAWRNDASNIETHYRRNWIRHKLLPYMQQQSRTDLTETLAALAQSALTLQQQVETSAAEILAPCRVCSSAAHANKTAKTGDSHLFSENLSAKSIQQSGPFVAGEVLRKVLTHLNCGLRDITLLHYKKFFQLLDKSRGTLQLPAGCTLSKKGDILSFNKTGDSYQLFQSKIEPRKSKISIPIPGTTQFANWRIQTRIIQITKNDLSTFQNQQRRVCSFAAHAESFKQWFDLKKIQFPLIVRCRRSDDAFTPFGRKSKKRITRFLTDSQIPENLRESCFAIEDNSGILWLAPVRRSALAPVTPNTTQALEIRVTPV
jgi:tRNA(Ile)-lysidine synthase